MKEEASIALCGKLALESLWTCHKKIRNDEFYNRHDFRKKRLLNIKCVRKTDKRITLQECVKIMEQETFVTCVT